MTRTEIFGGERPIDGVCARKGCLYVYAGKALTLKNNFYEISHAVLRIIYVVEYAVVRGNFRPSSQNGWRQSTYERGLLAPHCLALGSLLQRFPEHFSLLPMVRVMMHVYVLSLGSGELLLRAWD